MWEGGREGVRVKKLCVPAYALRTRGWSERGRLCVGVRGRVIVFVVHLYISKACFCFGMYICAVLVVFAEQDVVPLCAADV